MFKCTKITAANILDTKFVFLVLSRCKIFVVTLFFVSVAAEDPLCFSAWP